MTPVRVSRIVASRRVPRKACQANIGITAKMTSGALVLMKTANVVPSVSAPWITRSRRPASGSKVRVSRKSGSSTISEAAEAPNAASAPSHGTPSPVTWTVRPLPTAGHRRSDRDGPDESGDVALVEQRGPASVEPADQPDPHHPGGRGRAGAEADRHGPVVALEQEGGEHQREDGRGEARAQVLGRGQQQAGGQPDGGPERRHQALRVDHGEGEPRPGEDTERAAARCAGGGR